MQKSIFFLIFAFASITSSLIGQQFCNTVKITDSYGNDDAVIDCSYILNGKCLTLNAAYPSFNETSSYTVSTENYIPYGNYNEGTALNAEGDDDFFSKIPIPFNFCYFGAVYKELVIGTNGVITFDVSQLGKVNYPNVGDTNPSTTLPKSSIFGVYSDLVFSKNDDSEIYYKVIGTAPCRKLIINFYKGRLVGCSQTSTSQIVLSEGSNAIEIFVDEKPVPCAQAKFKNSLLGMINEDRTIGYSPAGRNVGEWASQNEAYKFTPSGSTILPQVNWFNSKNEIVGTGDSVSVCPENNEVYTVKVNYPLCGNYNYVLEDTSNITFSPYYPLSKSFTKVFCGGSSFVVNLDDFRADLTPQNPANFNFTFHTTLADAESGDNPQPQNFTLTSSTTFYVRVQNPNTPTCYRTSILTLTVLAKTVVNSTLSVCDTENNGVENNYLLSTFTPKIFTFPIAGSIHYFLSQSDADANVNEVTTANLINGTQLFVNYKTGNCTQTFGPITVNFTPTPVVNTPLDYQLTTCDFKFDTLEPFDFPVVFDSLITAETGVAISYYLNYDNAFSGGGSNLSIISEGKYPVFVRVENANGCFTIATINMDITFTQVEAQNASKYICFDGTQDVQVDLDFYSVGMLLETGVITTGYFTSPDAAELNVNQVSNIQTITEDGYFVPTIFYVRFTDSAGCYAIKVLAINLVNPIIFQSVFEVCDSENDGKENVTLAQFSSGIKGPQNATVTYYSQLSDATAGTNAITTFNVQNSAKLFAKIESYGCSNVFEFTVNLTLTPTVKKMVNAITPLICDNNNDGVEPFNLKSLQGEIYTGSEAVTFQFYTNYNAATNSFSGLIPNPAAYQTSQSGKAYAKVSFAGGCFSVSTINIELVFLPSVILKSAVLQKCDFGFNLNETFNLADATSQLFLQAENQIPLANINITYYKTEQEANAGLSNTQINAMVVTKNSRITHWARFTSKTSGCYSVAPIELQTYVPPKALNAIIADLCDDNLDGLYEVDLTLYTDRMVYTPSSDQIFTFFNTRADAEANTNPISNPKNFIIDPARMIIYVRTENITGCYDTASVELKFGKKVVLKNSGPFNLEICDLGNNGSEVVNLTQFENDLYGPTASYAYFPSLIDLNNNTNQITTPKNHVFNNTTGSSNVIVKVSTAGFCPEKAEINLKLKTTPIFSLPEYFLCPNGFIDIKPDFSGLDIVKFEWRNSAGAIISATNQLLGVKEVGIYTINVVAANGCTFSTTFKVSYFEVPIITNLIPNGKSYTVIASGSQTILYSIDNINYQTSNVFNDLPFGVITFYVKFEGSDCLGDPKKGLVLDIKNAFTPNDDGYNDTWVIDDLNVFDGKMTNLKVYNRFQEKIYEQNSATRLVWDGKTGLRGVATASYWYVLTLADGRIFTGWVLLKNRN